MENLENLNLKKIWEELEKEQILEIIGEAVLNVVSMTKFELKRFLSEKFDEMMSKQDRKRKTEHHIVPTSRWWSGLPMNKKILRDGIHSSFHAVFSNDTPTEQIERLLEMNSRALQSRFTNKILKILRWYDENNWVYRNWVFIPWYDD